METKDLELLKEALLKLKTEGPVRPRMGICGNLKLMLHKTPYRGTSVYSWVAANAYRWPGRKGRPVDYPVGDSSTTSWDPKDEFGARRLRFLDYLIECAETKTQE